MTKELLQQLQKFSQQVAELALNHSNSQQFDDMLGVKTEQFFDDHLKALAQQAHFKEQPDGTVIPVDPSEKAQQEQPASVDAYVGAREDAAIWKKRALEAEELNRKFIAELNGPTYLGEPVKQEQPAQEPVAWEGAEGWEPLAWHLCAEENGEEACNELIWEGGATPEPWGDRWLKYEHAAKQMIATVKKFSAPTQPALSDDRLSEIVHSTGPKLLTLAEQWANNEIHVYQYTSAAEAIVRKAIEAYCRGGAGK